MIPATSSAPRAHRRVTESSVSPTASGSRWKPTGRRRRRRRGRACAARTSSARPCSLRTVNPGKVPGCQAPRCAPVGSVRTACMPRSATAIGRRDDLARRRPRPPRRSSRCRRWRGRSSRCCRPACRPHVAHAAGHRHAVPGEHEVAAELWARLLGLPAEELAVEPAAAVDVGGPQIGPAGRSDRGSVTVGHDRSFGHVRRSSRTTAPGRNIHRSLDAEHR